MVSVVLVHGTGVRQDGYEKLSELVSGHLKHPDRHLEIVPCLWGEDHGARLHGGGASLPGQPSLDPVPENTDSDSAESGLAVWALLDADPLAELRIFSQEEQDHPTPYVPSFGEEPSHVVQRRLVSLSDDATFLATLTNHGLTPLDLVEATKTVTAALVALLAETRLDVSTLSEAVARAVVAEMVTGLPQVRVTGSVTRPGGPVWS
jgi:hypothetical protein